MPSSILPSTAPLDSSPNLRKRKRPESEDGEHPRRAKDIEGYLLDEDDPFRSKEKKAEVRMTCIRPPSFVFPKTAYSGHIPSLPRYSEENVLRDILVKEEDQHDSDSDTDGNPFVEADLQDFVIYRPHKSHRPYKRLVLTEYPMANELVSLHEINEHGVKHFYFDGVICYAGRRRYVEKIPFQVLSIGGYEEPERINVGRYIWIQSIEGARRGVWYRLDYPAAEYKRYHEPFQWVADLAKHLVDYLQTHDRVALSDMRHRFYDWLQNLYPANECVRHWLDQYGDCDFRRIVAAHANFLYFQAVQIDQKYERYPIWDEIHPKILQAIPKQVEYYAKKDMFVTLPEKDEFESKRKTTVTPYVFSCFKRLPWANFLYCQFPSKDLNENSHRTSSTNHTRVGSAKQKLEVRIPLGRESSDVEARREPTDVRVGDVVAIPKDNNSDWKTDDTEYFGYVQSVANTDKGQTLGLLWFYRPGDTTCLKMFYPFPRELFLSDHCNCGDPPILASEVIRKPQVTFGGLEKPSTEFFCRQRYVEGDGAWITLQDSHFRCGCRIALEKITYAVGDTLLVASSLRRSSEYLEPVVLLENDPDGLDGKIKVIRLLRKGRDYGCKAADANELVLTDMSKIIPMAYVQRRCQVRFYSEAEKDEHRIPTPYNRQGASDFFYITSQDLQTSGAGLESLQTPWPSIMRQGWDPASVGPQRKMRGLDLFCGGGNFGRGLEEGGSVRFDWAIDYYNQAIHTYKANLPAQNQTKLFRGSVNHYLSQALEGKGADLVAQVGEVEVICAGSPCQGFSQANLNKDNRSGLLNQSMAASVLAFIDFYRPKYALLENVKGMAVGDERHNVLAQLICCLVGMGYQVRTFCLDAWNFGCPQSRSRIIISIAAPGLTPLSEPAHTHSHPDGQVAGSLGKTANGLRTCSRTTGRTPFEYVTSAEATKDLPATDSHTTCIPFPDHRMSRGLPIVGWVRASSVPRFPGGCTFIKAFKQGYMAQAQIDSFNWYEPFRSRPDSKCWQRVSRNGLMPTVMTGPRPDDGACGTCLHWDDHRLLTIMEVRRAQGFPDHEVLIGYPADQWKIVGNSVARPVALALGTSLRIAWLANIARQEVPPVRVDAVLERCLNGTNDDGEIESPAVIASEESARNGWSAQNMLNKLTAALTSPRTLVSTISDTIGERLTNGDHDTARKPESRPLKHIGSVKAYEAGFEHDSVVTIGKKEASRLNPYGLEEDETSGDLNGYVPGVISGEYNL